MASTSETKWHPGSWTVEPMPGDELGRFQIGAHDRRVVVAQKIRDRELATGLAAFPDLYAAAERALKLLQEENAQRCPEEWLEVTDLRQALAKARGEEPRVQADADRDRGFPVCGALRGMESWQPTCSLPTGHEGPHRWGTP